MEKSKINEVKRIIETKEEIENLKKEINNLKKSRFYLFSLNLIITLVMFYIFYDTYLKPNIALLKKLANSYWGVPY